MFKIAIVLWTQYIDIPLLVSDRTQFKEMAAILEEEDVVAFAKKVVRCSDKSRQSFLRQFYKEKDPVLEGAFVEDDEEEHEDDEGKKNTPCKPPHKDGRCLLKCI